ncbi:hypothetical protein H1R20_g3293, partial [Candolleomyces eurysporus]
MTSTRFCAYQGHTSAALALRKRKMGGAEGGEGALESLLHGRNFDPVSRTLKKHGNAEDLEDTVEKNVKGLAERIITEHEEKEKQELDIFNIAPKRPNWDLKRDMEKKLARLERKTQEAIHTLIRQRLAAQNGQSDDLVGAMKAQERQNAADLSDDEED